MEDYAALDEVVKVNHAFSCPIKLGHEKIKKLGGKPAK